MYLQFSQQSCSLLWMIWEGGIRVGATWLLASAQNWPMGERCTCASPAITSAVSKPSHEGTNSIWFSAQWAGCSDRIPLKMAVKWQDNRILTFAGKSSMVTFISLNFSYLRARHPVQTSRLIFCHQRSVYLPLYLFYELPFGGDDRKVLSNNFWLDI